MAVVPYDPTPNARVDTSATARPIRIQTTPDMFGANIGRATEKLGSTLSQVGNELASTALQFARLDQETAANKAATDYFVESGKVTSSFHQLEGENPARQLEGLTGQLTTLRQSFRNKLSPYAAKLFDQSTERSMGYDIRNAGLYAAQQTKVAHKQSLADFQSSVIDQAMRDPNNDDRVADIVGQVKATAAKQSDVEGDSTTPGPNGELSVRENKIKTAVGSAVRLVTMAKAKTDPNGALAMLDKYRDQIHEPLYQSVREEILDRKIGVASESEAARITNPFQISSPGGHANFMHGQYGAPGENLTTIQTKAGPVTVNAAAAPAFQGFIDDMVSAGAPIAGLGGFNDRKIGRTQIESQHGYGNAIDWGQRGRDDAPAISKWMAENPDTFRSILRKYNMISGGDWHDRDRGHFEWGGTASTQQMKPLSEANLIDFQKEAEVAAQTAFPDDPIRKERMFDETMKKIMTRANVQQKIFNESMTSLRNNLHDTLNQTFKGTNRGPTSIQEAQSIDPGFADKYEQLIKNSPADKQKIDNLFLKNAKEEIPETQERRDYYTRYMGMSDTDRMQVDPYGAFNRGETTRALADKIALDQAKIKNKADKLQNIDSILGRNRALLNDLNAFPSHSPDHADANQRYQWLRGAAFLKMEEYEQQHKASMPIKEQEQMMKDLAKEVTTKPGWFGTSFGQTTKRQFELDFPTQINGKDQYDQLDSGQLYILDGVTYRKK